ncbi:unnamed protein product, partial [Cyprideis torosa]
MASTSDIRNGLCIEFNGEPFQIIEFLHVKPGKGPAFVRTKMRNLNTGRILDNTFPSGQKLKDIRIENRTYQYLYQDADGVHLMNMDTFEQIQMKKELTPEQTREILPSSETTPTNLGQLADGQARDGAQASLIEASEQRWISEAGKGDLSAFEKLMDLHQD